MKTCSGCASCNQCDCQAEVFDTPMRCMNGGDADNHCGILLVGNAKVGKSTLFNRLCPRKGDEILVRSLKRRVEKGFAGRTKTEIFNTPGILSVFTRNQEERVARDILIPDALDKKIGRIIIVADAKNLRRSVSLALQFAEYDLPMLFVVNMVDEASQKGIHIDTGKLSSILGIPVCETVARNGIGIDRVLAMIPLMQRPQPLSMHLNDTEEFIDAVRSVVKRDCLCHRALALQLLNHDAGVMRYIRRRFGHEVLSGLIDLARSVNERYQEPAAVRFVKLYARKADEIVKLVQVQGTPAHKKMSTRVGQLCMTPLTGIPIAVFVMGLMYLFVGSLGASFLVDTINTDIFGAHVIPWLTDLLAPIPFAFVRGLFVDPDFGIFPTGVFLALGLVTPVLLCFYIAFGILEDSGYLSRLAILLDRSFQKIGLNGKGIIPLAMGFSCVTMAILTTRVLDTEKEKNIMSFLLLLGMPCAPLLAVMLVILDPMPVSATITVFGIIITQLVIAGYFSNKIFFGARSPLIMEIQPMRFPRIAAVLQQALLKTFWFMKEALPVFVLASMLVYVVDYLGGLALLERGLKPVVSDFMGLPEKSVQVFIKTLIRRENGATEIEHLKNLYDNTQLVVNLLVMTFLSPCINATLVLIKERGMKTASAILLAVMIYALFIGGVINHGCRYFGITFT
ncbi:ferrous iron transport protein B [Desulfatiferula olefinivorans]